MSLCLLQRCDTGNDIIVLICGAGGGDRDGALEEEIIWDLIQGAEPAFDPPNLADDDVCYSNYQGGQNQDHTHYHTWINPSICVGDELTLGARW